MKETIGERLKRIRKSKNLTLEDIEKEINISNAALSRIETGKTEPKASTLKALSIFLNISADYLLFGDETQNQPLDERFSYLNTDEREQIEFLLNRAKKRHDDKEKYDKVGNL